LRNAGIPVRVDLSECYMHHKFAVFDRAVLLSGSYNWTRTAAERNSENVLVTDEPVLVKAFVNTFEGLWRQWAPEG